MARNFATDGKLGVGVVAPSSSPTHALLETTTLGDNRVAVYVIAGEGFTAEPVAINASGTASASAGQFVCETTCDQGQYFWAIQSAAFTPTAGS